MALDKETLDQLLSAVQRFVRERLVPIEEQVAETDRIPPQVATEMRELGLFGLSIPEEYGGLGLNMTEEVQVAFELGQTSPAFRSLLGTNMASALRASSSTEPRSRSIAICPSSLPGR